MREQGFEVAAPGDLAQEIQFPEIGYQGEIQAALQGSGVEVKRQTGGSSPQVRVAGRERVRQASEVLWSTPIDDVQMLGQSRRAVHRGRRSAHDDELDPLPCQQSEKGLEVGQGPPRSLFPARRKLVCELLQGHELLQALLDREPQVLLEQSQIDILLAGFDHGVRRNRGLCARHPSSPRGNCSIRTLTESGRAGRFPRRAALERG